MTSKTWRTLPMLAAWIALASSAHAVPGTINDQQGDIRFKPSQNAYEITAGGRTFTIQEKDVVSITIDKPADFDRAARLIAAGQYSGAVPLLETITSAYRGLQWDSQAYGLLVGCYMKTGQQAKAGDIIDKMIAGSGLKDMTPAMFSLAIDALGSDPLKKDKVKRYLDEAIASGNRSLAAMALVKRGDMKKKEGSIKDALVDGYLRAALMYETEKTVQPEALFKAAKAFEELQQFSHAEKMKKVLQTEYPGNEWTKKLGSS
jgi:hypothetical protein